MPPAQSRVARASLGVGVFVTAFVAGAAARAEPDEEEPIRLTYQAADGCPDEPDFVARIRAHTTRARVAWPGEAARTFDVAIDAGPPPSGSVTVLKPDGAAGTRRVQADTCADVADALALVIALSIDPHASPPPVAPLFAPPPAATPPAPDPPRPSPPPAPTTDDSRHETRSSSRPRGDVFAGVDLSITYGAAPNALVSGSPYVGWRANAAGVFDPSFRLALVNASSDAHVPTGSAAFEWTAGRLDACPVEWLGGPVRLTACARLEAGALRVAASDVPAAETRVRPWVAAGPLARAEWTFLQPIFLNAEIGGLLRPTNDRFYFQPDATVYQVPLFALSSGVGLGVHFL